LEKNNQKATLKGTAKVNDPSRRIITEQVQNKLPAVDPPSSDKYMCGGSKSNNPPNNCLCGEMTTKSQKISLEAAKLVRYNKK
jgi:hypothetical protein